MNICSRRHFTTIIIPFSSIPFLLCLEFGIPRSSILNSIFIHTKRCILTMTKLDIVMSLRSYAEQQTMEL